MGSASEQITFVDYRKPALENGDYEIAVTQTIDLDTQAFPATRSFTVGGERFALPPSAVRAVFPPDGSLGDHSNVVPHIVLDRPTLPWERHPGGNAGTPLPWLVLLLFEESERPVPTVIPLSELAGGIAYFPVLELERHQSPQDRVTVIDVRRSKLEELLPAYRDLPYLVHVRRGDGGDTAMVIGNRLPPPGGSSTVHLVSIEGRFHLPNGTGEPVFDLGSGDPDSPVRLVTLASWRFACVAEDETFPLLVRGLIDDARPFRLRDSGDPLADGFLRQGFVPMRHRLRNGGRTVSWYRGPFTTGLVADEPATPARTSDQLLRYHADVGMFDIGYAAAWQLGRLLALQSTGFATALYEWKRRRDQNHKRTSSGEYPLLVPAIDDALPLSVANWLIQLSGLHGVPFTYLVPDERLLPVETIRFVQLDQQWVRCLVDGAYSIGRLSQADTGLDRSTPMPLCYPQITGALIRSDVVSGYPGLLIDGYADEGTTMPLPVVRTERFSKNILLCLFKGVLARLDIRQRPESLHFAVELPSPGTFGKSLRSTSDDADMTSQSLSLALGQSRTLPMGELASHMATALQIPQEDFSAGDFARQMIETAEMVSFHAT